MSTTVWLYNPSGVRLAMVDKAESLAWTKVANGLGWGEVTLPGDFDATLLFVDGIVEIWRRPEGGTNYIEFAFFIRKITYTTDSGGVNRIIIAGPDPNELLVRRIIAYAAGTSQATKTMAADSLLIALANENLGSLATDANRDLTAEGLTVGDSHGDSASVLFSCAWDDLIGAAADLVSTAEGADSSLYWWVQPEGGAKFTLNTAADQPGQDRTTGSVVIFGLEWGNLAAPSLELDYTKEITFIYAGGQGEGADRTIVTASDAGRVGRSIWNRREAFEDARNESTTQGVTTRANTALAEGKPRLRFSGTLLDTPQSVYGKDWNFGDKVLVTYRGQQFIGLVKYVSGIIGGDGQEIIKAAFKIDDSIPEGGGGVI